MATCALRNAAAGHDDPARCWAARRMRSPGFNRSSTKAQSDRLATRTQPRSACCLGDRELVEEDAGEDGVVSGLGVDGDRDRSARGNADGHMDPDSLVEGAAKSDASRSAAVVHGNDLTPIGSGAIEGVQMQRPGVGIGEIEMEPQLGDVIDTHRTPERTVRALQI